MTAQFPVVFEKRLFKIFFLQNIRKLWFEKVRNIRNFQLVIGNNEVFSGGENLAFNCDCSNALGFRDMTFFSKNLIKKIMKSLMPQEFISWLLNAKFDCSMHFTFLDIAFYDFSIIFKSSSFQKNTSQILNWLTHLWCEVGYYQQLQIWPPS